VVSNFSHLRQPYANDHQGHVLNEFVRSCALPYLEDDNAEVRRAAALTCCRLFVRDPICFQASTHAIEVISDVLDKLLTVGIADPGKLFAYS
jgi:serine/threonine-protein kinase mTOR